MIHSEQVADLVGDLSYRLASPPPSTHPSAPVLAKMDLVGLVAANNLRPIILSPHLDDAELSIGGLIYRLNHAGVELSQICVFDANCEEDYRRKDEVHAAADVLGTSKTQIHFLGVIEEETVRAHRGWIERRLGRRGVNYLALQLRAQDRNLARSIAELLKSQNPGHDNDLWFVTKRLRGRGQPFGIRQEIIVEEYDDVDVITERR